MLILSQRRQDTHNQGMNFMQSEPPAQYPKRRESKEILSGWQRFGELVSAFVVLLILAFYLYHQFKNTGFFTPSFGGWAMFAFYGSIVLSLLPPISRAVIGRRNPVRPLEAGCNIFFAIALLYLLSVFPFNFAHFAVALPVAVRFLLSWITNGIAKAFMVLGIVAVLISAIVNIVKYLSFHQN
jgi:hypothetical protein